MREGAGGYVCDIRIIDLIGRLDSSCRLPIAFFEVYTVYKYGRFQGASRISLCQLSIPIKSIIRICAPISLKK